MDSVQTKEELSGLLLRNRNAIEQYGVTKVGIFGSFIKGTQNNESDVDLLVEFDPARKTFNNFINLAFFLEDLLHRKVEIVTKESISPYLKPYIYEEVEYVLS